MLFLALALFPVTQAATNEKRDDFIAYESLITEIRRGHIQQNKSWGEIATEQAAKWLEFAKKFPDSSLVPQAYIRMAEWMLTIHKNDFEFPTRQFEYGGSAKYRPELLHDQSKAAAKVILDKIIELYANVPHYSYLGKEKFGYNGDTVGSVTLYLRAIFFPETRTRDLKILKEKFSGTPSAKEAFRDFGKQS